MSLSNRLGLLGRKVGMMRIFTDDGDAIPVTVLDVSNNRVTQVKTAETDGYSAIQVAFGSRKSSRVTKLKLATSRKRASKPARSSRNSVLRPTWLPASSPEPRFP
jgi:large subunit ribosomal protein L3